MSMAAAQAEPHPPGPAARIGSTGAGASYRVPPAVPRQGLDGSGALRLTRPWTVCQRSQRWVRLQMKLDVC